MTRARFNPIHATRIQPLIEGDGLSFVFQPIANLKGGDVYGYEALVRGPENTALAAPEALLHAARQAGMTEAFELRCCELAIEAFARQRLGGKLFLNVSAPALQLIAADAGGHVLQVAREAGVAPGRLVFELTEHERVEDIVALETAVARLRAEGPQLAIDDFGDGRSSLRLWAQLNPEVVKIDRYFVREVHRDSRKLEVLRTVMSLAKAFGTPLVIEGVETAEELAVVRDLGCRFAQGYFIARPSVEPPRTLCDAVGTVLKSAKLAVLPSAPLHADPLLTVDALCIAAPTVTAEHSCQSVLNLFARHDMLHAVAVVAGSSPIGLINRRTLVDQMARPYHADLFGRRSCTLFMNADPLKVDRLSTIDSLVGILMGENQGYLSEGFILTDGGRYAGLATGDGLVRAVTERRIEAARLANPLTCLPGNLPITAHIRRLLDAQVAFAAAYFDLNNFKPYNDRYGYWRGDEMIKLAASAISAQCDKSCDFLGHVGGDDFVALFQSEDWEARCRRIIDSFAETAPSLYDARERVQGGLDAEDRRGFAAFFPITSLSVGIVMVTRGCRLDPEAIASAAAAAKKVAKGRPDFFHVLPADDCCAEAA
ncbi:EAL domain-containing protein [Denitromonas iodatirespirans]|uniref:EAL domain-containing protein n=1 Tax=Denitromonas iodatirespirans TaxID=2795389 RepID=A0A944H7I9_DENI1|nr:EAL domain-containing protein [Denitromonas iodatirespirans]MBT0961283.1 EAL domain-containing protein [Denitromonas iodatirespirans]